jgi:hypothetical protein
MESKSTTVMEPDSNPANRDPLTKEAGSHPLGTGVGSAGGAATGVAVGAALGGPVGAIVGGAIGAVAGGAAGHAAGEAVNPTVEGAYWSENYKTRPYYRNGQSYVDYEPGYRYGWESGARLEYRGRKFGEVEGELEKGWEGAKGSTARTWAQTRDITRDAWDRVHGD